MAPAKESFADWLDPQRRAEILREERWPNDEINCIFCGSDNIKKIEKYQEYFFRYECLDCTKTKGCKTTFNDKTGSIFEDSQLSLQKWFYAISLVQKKVSTNEIAQELQVDGNTVRRMVLLIKGSLFLSVCTDSQELSQEVEIDEAYVTAGCTGNNGTRPKERDPRKRGLKKKGRGTYETEKVPIVGMVQRQRNVHFEVTKNVQTVTVQPIIERTIASDTTIYTDEYAIYNFLDRSNHYTHLTVCHSKGEYALDLDGDGKYETHSNAPTALCRFL